MIYRFKQSQVFRYIVVGGFTTFINVFIFYVFNYMLSAVITTSNSYLYANVIAFICSLIFAFYANKYIVFKSSTLTNTKKELIVFLLLRVLSLIIDMLVMYVLVERCSFYEVESKVFANIVVIICNFLFSKYLVFK